MRVMVLIKANEDSENGVMPSEDLLTRMTEFNEELVKSGVMLAGEGLQPSSQGARVRFQKGEAPTVIDGPFAETKELLAGFWILEVKSFDEAVEWVKRIPGPGPDDPAEDAYEVEVRPVGETEDLGDAVTPELLEREQAMRDKIEEQAKEAE